MRYLLDAMRNAAQVPLEKESLTYSGDGNGGLSLLKIYEGV
jgi:hypothetical protein